MTEASCPGSRCHPVPTALWPRRKIQPQTRQTRLVTPQTPENVMTVRRTSLKSLRCGGNNCAIPDPQIESIADDFKVWIETARTAALKVNVCSIPPRLKPVHAAGSIFCLNAAIQSMTSDMDVSFANMHDLFHLQNVDINDGYLVDYIHLTLKGTDAMVRRLGVAMRQGCSTAPMQHQKQTAPVTWTKLSTCQDRSQRPYVIHQMARRKTCKMQMTKHIDPNLNSLPMREQRQVPGKKITNVQRLGAVVPVNHVPNQVNEEIDSAKRILHLKPIYEINSDKAMNITQETPSRATDMVVGIVVNLTTTLRTVGMVNPLYVTTVDIPVMNLYFARMIIHMGTLQIIQCPMGEAVIDIEGTQIKGKLRSPLIHQSLKTIKLTARWCL